MRISHTVDGYVFGSRLLSQNNGLIHTTTIQPGEVINYTLRVWIDLASTNEIMGQRFFGKLEITATP